MIEFSLSSYCIQLLLWSYFWILSVWILTIHTYLILKNYVNWHSSRWYITKYHTFESVSVNLTILITSLMLHAIKAHNYVCTVHYFIKYIFVVLSFNFFCYKFKETRIFVFNSYKLVNTFIILLISVIYNHPRIILL